MKVNFKAIIIAMGFVMTSGLFSAGEISPVVDPDLAVYNAIASLCTDGAIAALTTTANADALLKTISDVKIFLSATADGTIPAASSAGNYLNKLDTWTESITKKKVALNAEAIFSKAVTDANTLDGLSGVFALFNTGGSLFGKEGYISPSSISNFYNKISIAYNSIFIQSPAKLSEYLTSMFTLLNLALNSNLAFKEDFSTKKTVITDLQKYNLSDPIDKTNVTTVLKNENFKTAAKVWRRNARIQQSSSTNMQPPEVNIELLLPPPPTPSPSVEIFVIPDVQSNIVLNPEAQSNIVLTPEAQSNIVLTPEAQSNIVLTPEVQPTAKKPLKRKSSGINILRAVP